MSRSAFVDRFTRAVGLRPMEYLVSQARLVDNSRGQVGRRFTKDWGLSAAIEHLRRKLAGADYDNRQMADILNAVLTDGLQAGEAACAEAIAHGVHSADVVLNITARQSNAD